MSKKLAILLTLCVLLITPTVSAFVWPSSVYCERQGYQQATVFEGDYRGEKIEQIIYHGTDVVNYRYNGSDYEIAKLVNLLNLYDGSDGTLTLEETKNQLNYATTWSERQKTICEFTDGTFCETNAFYEGTCGQEHRKELSCRKEGESVHTSFETCCGSAQPYSRPGWVGGMPTCVSPLKNTVYWTIGGVIVALLLAIGIVLFLVLRKTRK